jgi:hypothetical protein
MRTGIVSLVCLLLFASDAAAQNSIAIYEDPAGTYCNILEVVPGVRTFYAVLHTTGATAVAFSAPLPSCTNGMTILAELGPCPLCIAGTIPGGAWVSFGECVTGAAVAVSIQVFAFGLSSQCCAYPVLPHPNLASGKIEMVDCDDNTVFLVGGTSYFNVNPSVCDCFVPLPTEQTSWGRIKALYGE